jgi:hypothetical protein
MTLYFTGEDWYVTCASGPQLFRDFMRERREARGWAKSRLQLEAGINHPRYLQFEDGTAKTPIAGLEALQALNLDLYIFGGKIE